MSVSDDPVRIAQFWQAVEIFSPRPLPDLDPRVFTVDIQPGEPMPWEPGFRRTLGPPAHGNAWRHTVYGGVFPLSRVLDALTTAYGAADPPSVYPPAAGESALFACTVDDSGTPLGPVFLSGCAWSLGRAHTGKPPLSGLAEDTLRLAGDIGRLADVRPGVRALAAALRDSEENRKDDRSPDGEAAARDGEAAEVPPERTALTGADLRRFTIELAVRLGVNGTLSPRGIRIRSYQVKADAPATVLPTVPQEGEGDLRPSLASVLHDDLERVTAALKAGDAGLALTQFLTSDDQIDRGRRTDVRQHPLWVLDWSRPDLIPPGRWVTSAERPLVFSQQFAVNQIMRTLGSGLPGLFTLNGPPGTGETAVFRDLVAAIVVQRATELAQLIHPEEGFLDKTFRWQSGKYVHRVTRLSPKLTGHEIVIAAKDDDAALKAATEIPGADGVGARWREAAAAVGYFTDAGERLSVSSGGPGVWGLLAIAPKQQPSALSDVHATLTVSLNGRDSSRQVSGWRAAVDRFAQALAKVEELSAERSDVSRHIADLPDAVAGRDQAATAVRKAQAERDILQARRQELDAGRSELSDRPNLMSLLSAGGRRDLRERRETERALTEIDQQMAGWFEAETAADAEFQSWDARAQESRRAIDEAKRRWGERVPDGPEYAETRGQPGADLRGTDFPRAGGRDLVERRELSAPWADEEFCRARTELFLAALALHKAFVLAQARQIRANLGALADMLAAQSSGRPGPEEPGVALAAWQTLFLVVPVVSATFASFGPLFAGLGRESIGWVLADEAGLAGPQEAAGALWRARRAVIAGDPLQLEPVSMVPWSGQRALLREFGVSQEWAPARASAQLVADRLAAAGTSVAGPSGAALWVGCPIDPQCPPRCLPQGPEAQADGTIHGYGETADRIWHTTAFRGSSGNAPL